MRRDPYDVLGIPTGTSLDEAEDAYHALLRRDHPDLHHGEGPERIARAERRTRELNAAISDIRDADSLRAGAGPTREEARPGAGRGRPGDDGPRDDGPGTTHAAEDGQGIWDEEAAEWTVPPDPRQSAPCPWCGEVFDHAVDLKDHVFARHDFRVDRRERGGFLGGRFHRWLRGAAHLPLWGIVPINLALALLIGILVALPTSETIGRWAFLIALAPSIVALVDRAFDLGS